MAIIPSGQKFHTVASSVDTVDRKSARFNSLAEAYTIEDIAETLGGGGALEGTNYIGVMATGTPTENGTELQDAYDTAKTMSPSASNRITVIAAPGYYKMGELGFTMDTSYIDLVSLDGNRSIIFDTTPFNPISVTANDVYVRGVDVGFRAFAISSALNLLRIENCKGGSESFRAEIVSGTFIDCIGGDDSFKATSSGFLSGTFKNCVGGDYSFAGFGCTISGLFENCTGGYQSLGAYGTASGIFTNCVGGAESFGGWEVASGTFTNCVGGNISFGGNDTASGTFIECQGGEYSFGGSGVASGTFKRCVADNYSLGSSGTASGVFIDCEGGEYCFGGAGTASGVFNKCISGQYSFGTFGTLSGKLYYCRLTAGTFPTVSGGVTRVCIDGFNNEDNQG